MGISSFKISMFCVLSQNYQHFFWKIIYAPFKLWIKTVKILFWSITQEVLDLLKILVPWTIYNKMHYVIFHKGVDNF